VEVSRRGWVGYTPPAPAEDPKSDTAPAAASDAGGDDSGEVSVNPFADDMRKVVQADAAQLRDAVWAANRPDRDQYGTEL
jgi:hypothetical protein